MSRLKEKYEKEVVSSFKSEFGIKKSLGVPRVTKVVVNAGVGAISNNKEALKQAKDDLAKITGQSPSVCEARKAVSSFSIMRGAPVGLKVTLRGIRMYDFLDRLFSVVLPRIRDFRGLSLKSFDKKGNYTLGIEELAVFPEVDIAKATSSGLEITIVTSANDKKTAKRLLDLLGMPFEKIPSAK
ncbi:MAG: 50S ribosomal protein L5 [Patescibacteria group bacterium]